MCASQPRSRTVTIIKKRGAVCHTSLLEVLRKPLHKDIVTPPRAIYTEAHYAILYANEISQVSRTRQSITLLLFPKRRIRIKQNRLQKYNISMTLPSFSAEKFGSMENLSYLCTRQNNKFNPLNSVTMEKKKEKEKKMEVEIKERYVNPYTDFGFKKLFGTELNKDLLISFLNALFNDKLEITELNYLNTEHLGEGITDRKAVFDVYCQLADGKRIIVEMQKAEQQYFKDRSIYYSTYPIREQAPKGNWNYRLADVYTVGILNFTFPKDEYPDESMIHEIKLKDVEDNHIFYDKLTFIYLEMPKFNKKEEELETMFDKWLFALSNLVQLLERPKALQERIFARLFEQAEIAHFTPEERNEYVASRKDYWDYYSTMTTSYNKGHAKGMEEGRAEERLANARSLKENGASVELIAKSLGLSTEEIEKL